MRGKGIAHLHGHGRGDQLVRVIAWTPQKLSKGERRLLEELRDADTEPVPSPGRNIFR